MNDQELSKSHGQLKNRGLPTPCFWLSWMPTNRVQTLVPYETSTMESLNIKVSDRRKKGFINFFLSFCFIKKQIKHVDHHWYNLKSTEATCTKKENKNVPTIFRFSPDNLDHFITNKWIFYQNIESPYSICSIRNWC